MPQRALTELLRGRGAHVDPLACIEDLPAGMAARQVPPFPHSIGQLVFHMNYWMDYELQRIRGHKPKYPEHNSESFPPSPAPANPEEWDEMRERFAALLEDLAVLAQSSRVELDRELESIHDGDKDVAATLESVLWQMVAHNSYHIGQVALIRRALGAWPPPAGGDTW